MFLVAKPHFHFGTLPWNKILAELYLDLILNRPFFELTIGIEKDCKHIKTSLIIKGSNYTIQVSLSPIFYKQLFCMKVFSSAFLL